MKFSTKNTIKIKAAYDREAELLLVHVIDKGRGISETDKKKLFTLFGKLEATEEINSEGIGMGLVICYRIVQNNGGTIEVFSEGLDKGSTFIFSMRMTVPDEES